MSPSPAPVTQTSEARYSQRGTDFSPSTAKTMTLGPKTSNSLETGPIPRRDTLSEGFTMSPNSRITSDPTPLTASRPPLISTTTRANKISRRILPSVIPSTIPGSANPNQASNTDLQAEIIPNMEEKAAKQTPVPDTIMIPVPSPSTQRSTTNKYISPVHDTGGSETTRITTRPIQKPIAVLTEHSDENPLTEPVSEKDSTPGQKRTPDRALIKPPDQEKKSSEKIPKINQNPKPNENHTDLVTGQKTKQKGKPKPEQRPQTNQRLRTLRPDQMPELNPKSLPKAESNKTSKLRPTPKGRQPIRPKIRPGATHVKRPKPAVPQKPSLNIKTDLDPLQISKTTLDNINNSETDMSPSPAPATQTSDSSNSQRGTEFSPSTTKTIPRRDTLSEGFTMSPNSRITSDPTPLIASRPPLIQTTKRANKISRRILPSIIPSTIPGSTNPNQASNTDLQAEIIPNMEEKAAKQTPVPDTIMIPVPSPSTQTTSTINPNLRSTTSSPKPLAAEFSTPSARELRVKIKQVAAFFNNSLSPNGRPLGSHPKDHAEDNQVGSRPESKLPSKVTRDCSDYLAKGSTKSGMYLVTPDLRSRSFPVFCDMQLDGGGWTVLQRRQDGSVSFNRTWAEYRLGFGELDKGEFWLGNNMIHMLTRARNMVLRVELEDFGGVREYAQYESFSVASERGHYRLTVGDYSGTAGDALRFSKMYDHHNRAFTTPDRDHDRYPSGNCGAYYSSGWWFDACMAANLNGKYYVGKYKGVRDGIFWGTWQNISSEYYPTNDRQSFKTVRMMIRPRGLAPLAGTLYQGML
ncbi:flocculation protein FLO11-like [Notothenia coriiceps]|uniref:Flocculation protein FLO11-like n=1 Tax=Notothenia coriiceps TaxID=8208 RepID=A0A6I9MRQ8_9TELE|nr:PREDICTED: flocculation protein FLO11-like [Notothenia coriiceps]